MYMMEERKKHLTLWAGNAGHLLLWEGNTGQYGWDIILRKKLNYYYYAL